MFSAISWNYTLLGSGLLGTGTVLKDYLHGTLEGCRTDCDTNSECKGFVFKNASTTRCQTYNDTTTKSGCTECNMYIRTVDGTETLSICTSTYT